MKPDKSGEIYAPQEPVTRPPEVPEDPGKCKEGPVIAPIQEPVPAVTPAEIPDPEKAGPGH